jgi:methionyl-tRNA formyltransferase
MSANSIFDLVRALTHPYVGAHFVVEGIRIKVWGVRIYLDAPDNLEHPNQH